MSPKFNTICLEISVFLKINNNYAVPVQLNQYPLY